MRTRILFYLLLPFALILLAQTNAPPEVPGGSGTAFGTPQFWIDLATPFIGPILTAVVKLILPKIPRAYIPAIAVVLGVLTNALGTVVIGGDVVLWKAVALGLAGIGVRELKDRIVPETIGAAVLFD
jgi:hypothetical protein